MDVKAQTIQERWKQRAEAAFERMFGGKSAAELETLTQREDEAVLIGRELAAFLLEEQVALDPAVQPSEASSACCPKCGRAGTPAVQKEEELPERTVVTRTGEIRVRRQRWRSRSAGSFFFPLDVKLQLGTEGYSPAVLSKAVRQASKAASFAEASDDLRNLADVEISATHLQRISERIGQEWAEVRDQEVEKFRESKLARTYQEAPRGAAAAVMLDGGRLQTRADDHGRGVSAASWRESKVACCLTLQTKAAGVDPHPEPPAKFLDRGPPGLGDQASQPPVLGTERRAAGSVAGVRAQEAAEEEEETVASLTAAEVQSYAGPHGRGHDGQQRNLWLAGSGRGASSRARPGQTQSLCLRRPGVQLVGVRDALVAFGIHRGLGFCASTRVSA